MTSTSAPCCTRRPSLLQRTGRWAPGSALGWGLAALALPKCPACIAGYLSVLGIGLGFGAEVAGLLRPTFITLAVLATALTVLRVVRHARHRRATATGR